jgi:hypothetical protein
MRRSSREDRRAETALGERHVRRGLWVRSTWVPLQKCSSNSDPSRPESELPHAGSWGAVLHPSRDARRTASQATSDSTVAHGGRVELN